MLWFCGDILYEILSADMKSSLYIVVINIIYYSNKILFSFYVKHVQNYICVCNIMCISITGLGLKLNLFMSVETLNEINLIFSHL